MPINKATHINKFSNKRSPLLTGGKKPPNAFAELIVSENRICCTDAVADQTKQSYLVKLKRFTLGTDDAVKQAYVWPNPHMLIFNGLLFSRSSISGRLDDMKIITAYVRAECAPKVMRKLHEAGVGGLTAYWVHGISGETSTFLHSKRPYELSHLPESLKIEVICDDESVDKVVELIAQQTRTGLPGDGLIAIQHVERVQRIRDIVTTSDG